MATSVENRAQSLANTSARFLVASRAVRILQRRIDGRRPDSAAQGWANESEFGFLISTRNRLEVLPNDKKLVELRDHIEHAARELIKPAGGSRVGPAINLAKYQRQESSAHKAFTAKITSALQAPSQSRSHWAAAVDAIGAEKTRTSQRHKYLEGADDDLFVDRRVALDTLLVVKFWFQVEAKFEIEAPLQSLV